MGFLSVRASGSYTAHAEAELRISLHPVCCVKRILLAYCVARCVGETSELPEAPGKAPSTRAHSTGVSCCDVSWEGIGASGS